MADEEGQTVSATTKSPSNSPPSTVEKDKSVELASTNIASCETTDENQSANAEVLVEAPASLSVNTVGTEEEQPTTKATDVDQNVTETVAENESDKIEISRPDSNQNAQSECQEENMEVEVTAEPKMDDVDLSRKKTNDNPSQANAADDGAEVKTSDIEHEEMVIDQLKASTDVMSEPENEHGAVDNHESKDNNGGEVVKNIVQEKGSSVDEETEDKITSRTETEPAKPTEVKSMETSNDQMITETSEVQVTTITRAEKVQESVDHVMTEKQENISESQEMPVEPIAEVKSNDQIMTETSEEASITPITRTEKPEESVQEMPVEPVGEVTSNDQIMTETSEEASITPITRTEKPEESVQEMPVEPVEEVTPNDQIMTETSEEASIATITRTEKPEESVGDKVMTEKQKSVSESSEKPAEHVDVISEIEKDDNLRHGSFNLTDPKKFWMYQARFDDPDEIKKAAPEAEKESKFSLSEENSCTLNEIEKEKNNINSHQWDVNFSFPSRRIHFTCDTQQITVDATDMRNVKVQQEIHNSEKRYILRFSYRNGDDLDNFVFLFDDALSSLICLNLFRYMMYSFYGDVLMCTLKDYEPKIALKPCTAIVSSVGASMENSAANANGEIPCEKEYFCTMDIEGIFLSTSIYFRKPKYSLFFYEEMSAIIDVVDKIVVEKEKVTLRSERLTIEFPKMKQEIPDVINILKYMRPRKKEAFQDPKLEGYPGPEYYAVPSRTTDPNTASSTKPTVRETIASDGEAVPENAASGWEAAANIQGASAPDPPIDVQKEAFSLLTEQLNQAVQLCDQVDEQLQEMWLGAESTIQHQIDSGFVPETDAFSGGIDPNNVEHFKSYITAIEDHLMSAEYSEAISKTKGLKTIFADSNYSDVTNLLQDNELDLMKKIFFRPMVQDKINPGE